MRRPDHRPGSFLGFSCGALDATSTTKPLNVPRRREASHPPDSPISSAFEDGTRLAAVQKAHQGRLDKVARLRHSQGRRRWMFRRPL
jgi:hypothetical protein